VERAGAVGRTGSVPASARPGTSNQVWAQLEHCTSRPLRGIASSATSYCAPQFGQTNRIDPALAPFPALTRPLTAARTDMLTRLTTIDTPIPANRRPIAKGKTQPLQRCIETGGGNGQKDGQYPKGTGVIELSKVAYSYGGAQLFSDLTLTLAPGSFHFLTGPSGAGKTTLMKLCYAELVATSGMVKLFGKDARDLGRDGVALARRRIGVVHQDCQFLDHLPLADNVTLPLTLAGRGAEAQANLPDLLAWVGLTAQARQLPPELSGGERQRAALARAVIMSPDVILADEPTGNIDWDMSQRLLTLLVELNKMGKAVLIATHDLNLIRTAKAQVSARVLRLADRRLVAAGVDL